MVPDRQTDGRTDGLPELLTEPKIQQISSDFLFISAYQIEARHAFLEALLGKVKPEETESLETARTLVTNITTCLCVFSLMEAVCYYLFSTAVSYKNRSDTNIEG